MSQNGKGDRNRVSNHHAYRDHYDAIFRAKRPGGTKPLKHQGCDQIPLKGCSTAMRAKRKPLTSCAAGRDGECCHPDCPQIRDNEPHATGRSCPLWNPEADDEC